MIDDSWPWKERLKRERASAKRRLRQGLEADGGVDEAALVAVEAYAFLVAYVTRKLLEAQKLSDELEEASMEVVGYPWTGKELDHLNAHRVADAYDFDNPSKKRLKLRDLCNLLIHSFVFLPTVDETNGTCTGFLVNSDRTKHKEVLLVDWDDFDLLVTEVSREDVVTAHYDRRTGDLAKSRVGEGEPKPRISLNARQAAPGIR